MAERTERFDQAAYINEYNKEHYGQLTIRWSKRDAGEIRAAAKASGKSLSSWLLEAAKEKIGRG